MLVAKSSLNYVEFVKQYFNKDIMEIDKLFILPLGFKLPFRPEDFLSNKAATKLESKEAKEFMQRIVNKITNMKEQGIEESIVLGFNVYLESIKKCNNSDLIVAIDNSNKQEIKIFQERKIKITEDVNAPTFRISDEGIIENYPLTYTEVWKICKNEIEGFIKGKRFDNIMKELKENSHLSYKRKVNPKSVKSGIIYLYSKDIIDEIKKRY